MALDTVGELAIKIVPDASGFGTATGQAVGQNQGSFANAGKVAGAALAGGAVAAFGKGIADFTQFERGLNEVFTLIPDAGEAAFNDLTQQTKDFAKEFGVLPQEVIKPLYDSISAGVPRENVFTFLEEANKFAKAGATDLTTSVDALTTGVNAFGLESKDAGRVADSLLTAVKGGKTTVEELAASLFQVAPVAGSFGIQIEEVSAAFATLTASGTPTAAAATQIKGAISELGKEGTKANQTFQDLTGQGFTAFIEGGGTFEEATQILAAGAEEAGISVLDLFGSIEAGQAVLGLTGDKAEVFGNNLAAQADAAGATQEAFERMEQGIGPALDKIKARLGVAFIELGTTIAPAVETFGTLLADVVLIISQLPGPLSAAIVGFAGLAGGILVLAGPITKAITLISGIGKAFGALSALLAANPIILIALAIAGAAFLIYKNWDTIVEFFSGVWDKVKGIFEEAIKFIEVLVGVFFKGDFIGGSGWLSEDGPVVGALFAIREFFVDVWDRITGIVETALGFLETITRPWVVVYTAIFSFAFNALSTFFETWVGRLQALFTNLFQWMTTAFTTVASVLTAIWQPLWDTISAIVDVAVGLITQYITIAIAVWTTIFQTVWAVVQAVFQTAWDVISGIVTTGVGVVKGLIDTLLGPIGGIGGALETMKGVFQTVWDTVKNIMQGAYDFVVDLAGKIGNAVEDALGPVGDIAGFAGGVLGGGARLLGFDEGGVVPGPKGSPRIILAHAGETILPTHKTPLRTSGDLSTTTGGGGGGMVIQGPLLAVTGPVTVRSDEDITELSRAFARETQRTYRAAGRQTGA